VQDCLLERLASDFDLIERQVGSRWAFGRSVAHYLVQPPTQVPDVSARAQRGERAQEGLLQEILRAPIRAEAAGQREQLRAVALHDRRERAIVARPREAYQPLV
jgi:hypothetical protein